MKRTAKILAAVACSAIFMASCDLDFPYKPKQFVPPALSIPLASRNTIKNFLEVSSYKFKLAFTLQYDQNVYIIDFSDLVPNQNSGQDFPKVIKLQKDPKRAGWMPDSPLLSPDGNLVAYFLRGDVAPDVNAKAVYVQPAQDNASPVEVASHGTDPHFWKDSTGKMYIIYSDRFSVASNTIDSLTGFSTFRQQIDPATGSPMGDRSVLVAKPFNGGISKNGRYLCTGYIDGAMYDLYDSTLYRINYIAPSSMQICNPSISPDSTHPDWMLFLNFAGVQQVGFASGITPLVAQIDIHQYLLIADKTNTVQWYIKCPADHFEWQCPEWTNDSNYIAALAKVARSDSDKHYDCYLIRRSDNALLKLTDADFKMDNTATPSFWISPQAR